MNSRKRTRRATTIDVVNSIPTKQGKIKKTDMKNSNPEIEMQTTNESENETANSQNSNVVQDEVLTQPLFAGMDPSDILAYAEVVSAQMDAYVLETSSHQNGSAQLHKSDTKQKPSTSTANDQAPGSTSNEQSPNRTQTAENVDRSANDSLQSSSTANQSQYDDSVILIDDGASAMPRPSRSDEDVIFVEEYVKEPPRVTGVVDLCDEDEDESSKKIKLTPAGNPGPSAQVVSNVGRLPTSTVASTSSGINVKCPVCLDSVPNDEVHSTICGHLFCKMCLVSTVKSRKKCPMCNRSLTLKQIHRIYFHN